MCHLFDISSLAKLPPTTGTHRFALKIVDSWFAELLQFLLLNSNRIEAPRSELCILEEIKSEIKRKPNINYSKRHIDLYEGKKY